MSESPGGDSMPPARLSVAFAADANVGVIMRRGPSDWVRMILWDTERDKFTPGQWLHARVPTFAVSPSGRFLLTVVLNHAKPPHSWIALSRPPYFTALAVWQHRHLDGWSYCAFPEEDVIVVEQTFYAPELLPGASLHGHSVLSRNEVLAKYGRPPWRVRHHEAELSIESGERMLRYRGHSRVLAATEFVRPAVDHRGRLVFTKNGDGTLYAATIREGLSLEARALANFDEHRFEEMEAPEWARR